MPSQTFFNLSEAKRKAFLETAIEEFAGRDYESASISRIVATLGIAKGSVYQYFEDKRDLYLFLIDYAAKERVAFVSGVPMPDPQQGFYRYTQWLLEMGVRFALEHPRLNQLIYQAMFGTAPFRDDMLQRLRDSSLQLIRDVIAQGIAVGEIDPDIDLDMTTYLLNVITNEFGNYLASKLAIDPQRLLAGDQAQLDNDSLRSVYSKALDFVWHGLAKRSTAH